MSIDFKVSVNEEILAHVSKLDRFRGEWPSVSALPAERLSQLREAATVQSIASSCRLSGIQFSGSREYGRYTEVVGSKSLRLNSFVKAVYCDANDLS